MYEIKQQYLNRIFQIAEVDECKSPGPASLMIIDNLYLVNGAKVAEELPEVSLLCVQAQPKHPEAAARFRVLPTPLVAPSSRHRRSAVTPNVEPSIH